VETKTSRYAWLSHVVPIIVTVLAVAMLILTPIWAVEVYHHPFIGVLLEPNNVVSRISSKDWPASQKGAVWPQQLASINGIPVKNVQEVNAFLAKNDYLPVSLVFKQNNVAVVQFELTPIRMPSGDFITLFWIPYLVGLIFLLIGLWAYWLRGGLRASRALLIFAAAVSITASTFFDMNTTHHVVVLWAVSLSVAASATIHLALVFPQQLRLVDRWPATRFISWIFCVALAVPAILEITTPSSPLAYITTWQAIYAYIVVAICIFLAMLIWRILRSDRPVVRQQSRIIVFGAALAFAPIMVLYFLPTAFTSTPQEFKASIYFPLLILLPLSIAYAILRYRLLDVDRFLANVLNYILMTGVVLLVFYSLVTLLSLIIRQTIRPDNPVVIALYLLALVLGLTPLRKFIQHILDRFFYRSPADYRRVLNTLSGNLVATPNLERTLQILADQLSQALTPEIFHIYLYDDERKLYIPHSRNGYLATGLMADDPLIRVISAVQGALWFAPNKAMPDEVKNSAAFRDAGCSTFVPLRYEGKLIGFMALGHRRSGEPYSSDDLDFLSTVAGQSSLALENARLFTNLHRTLDQTLEMKNLMDDIFASIATGVITTDVKHKITLFNQAAANILITQANDVLGKSLIDALPHYPDLETAALEAVEGGKVTQSREVTPITPRGNELVLRLSCAPLLDASLDTKGATIVIEDLTEKRKLEVEQERIRQTFGRIVAPRVRDRLLSDPSHLRLDGTSQKVTILFADISGFTPFSESTPPETLFKVLNEYLSLAAHAILEEEGTLDKFIGDAVMALWNAPDPQPDHALRAVRAALAILDRSQQAYDHMKTPAHHLQFRIGVATGEAVVGNVGTRELFNYTAIGDTVNVAQRLEVIARPSQILIDQSTYSIVSKEVSAEMIDPVQIKGKTQPVVIYQLKGLR
jgi:PAS domain S-box-containing protein